MLLDHYSAGLPLFDTLAKIGPYDGHISHLGTDEVYPGAGHADGRSARPGWWQRLRRAGAPRRR